MKYLLPLQGIGVVAGFWQEYAGILPSSPYIINRSFILAFCGGTERCRHGVTECNWQNGKFSLCSVRLEVTVGRFPQNRTHPFGPKVHFQAESFKLLAIRFVPFRRKRQV
uniref:Uncharacterized protein n=1 Tax=Romanomermis culicivorax TaxID=13658 RepID=A0A915JXK2_ROMCU